MQRDPGKVVLEDESFVKSMADKAQSVRLFWRQ